MPKWLDASASACLMQAVPSLAQAAHLLEALAGAVSERTGAQVGQADGALAGGEGKGVALYRVEVRDRDDLHAPHDLGTLPLCRAWRAVIASKTARSVPRYAEEQHCRHKTGTYV